MWLKEGIAQGSGQGVQWRWSWVATQAGQGEPLSVGQQLWSPLRGGAGIWSVRRSAPLIVVIGHRSQLRLERSLRSFKGQWRPNQRQMEDVNYYSI